jgi:acyl-CoA reductase-like NAD-dependent aldehyde dehydrogenase
MPQLTPIQARTGQPFGSPVEAHTAEQVNATANAAAQAFDSWSGSSGAQRAVLLRALATALEADRAALVELADMETALGPVRLNGELDRTAFQLRRFADIAERGVAFAAVEDPAVAGGPPVGHPALLRVQQPLGPVAMFSASNFPFAFSVLGGDTASALAAGCPVVVKVHPAHVALSVKTLALIADVLKAQGLPAGLISGVIDAGYELGVQLLQHPAIAAGAFTGSTRGGAALQAAARQRAKPIPFYGELGSVNPLLMLPGTMDTAGDVPAQAQALGATLAGSITLGCGQFCTSPGVIVLVDEGAATKAANDLFVQALTAGLKAAQPHAMLTPGMRRAFEGGVAHWRSRAGAGTGGVTMLLDEPAAADAAAPRAALAQADVAAFVADAVLREEVFGPAAMIVRVADAAQAAQLLQAVGGSLTVTIWGAATDSAAARTVVRAATQMAGRVLFAGVPTGVAVTAGMHHGGPWPSSTEPASTSVGDAALSRFLRPVALQDAPAWLAGRAGVPL